ncbi:hypothetical protein H5410_012864 [Solanum commersonii]|uniref:Uncharacterized protein n=1 Tax=Solanum commersonii TaxID=4109 RepID=A0A9J6ASW0_SOLCO|nr:hypothetical protein H5410_012864 [Solanum commersonii]
MEGLSLMLVKAKQLQWVDGFTVNVAEKSPVLYLNLTLMLFEAMSGLHFNMTKSIIYHMNDVSELNMLVEICNGVIQKFEKRLASWQRQYLSLRGRFILINGVLNPGADPRSVLRHPLNIKLDGASGLQLEMKVYLGWQDLAAHNRSMLMKWHWRYNLEDPRLWKDVITAKYGSHSNWTSNPATIPHGKGRDFLSNTSFEVGNGATIKFWKINGENNTQSPLLSRHLQDWEVEDLMTLLNSLQNFTVNNHNADRQSGVAQ